MSSSQWINSTGGDWSAAANWNPGVLPGVLDTVQINAPGTYQVTLSTTAAVQSVQMLSTGASLLDTGTLDLAGALSLGAGLFTLASGGEIVGGTLSTSGGSFDWAGGTLSGATYSARWI